MYLVFSKERVFSGITDRLDADSLCDFVFVEDLDICNNIMDNLDKKIVYKQNEIELYEVTDYGDRLLTKIDLSQQ
jgi:hypothetical protein